MFLDKERDIHEFLRYHPYLISRRFRNGLSPLYEEVVTESGRKLRIDLLFERASGFCVVEIKKTVLQPENVDQVVGYCRALESHGKKLAQKHYLVGRKPGNTKGLLTSLKQAPYNIKPVYYVEDIPLSVIYDTEKGEYVSVLEAELSSHPQRFNNPRQFKL